MGLTVSQTERNLAVMFSDGSTSQFHYIWLRDNCRCPACLHPTMGERLVDTAAIPLDIAPREVEGDAVGLSLVWPDGHETRYDEGWLWRHRYDVPRKSSMPKLWDASIGDPGRFDHDRIVSDPAAMRAFLAHWRDFGYAIVENVPAVPGEVERFANRIAYVREVNFGRVHDVMDDPSSYNVASTAGELKPHTDLTSYNWPPSAQLLHCLMHEATGADSILVDGWNAAARLREKDPSAYETLSRVAVTFRHYDENNHVIARAPMFVHDPDGKLCLVRMSPQTLLPLDIPPEDVEPFYRAYGIFAGIVENSPSQLRFRLKSGDMMCVHNHRVMHGRTAFDPLSGPRHLQDTYMEFDDILGRIKILEDRLATGLEGVA